MAVDYDTFLEWAKDRFGEENIKVRHTAHGDEILTHSFYAHKKGIDDYTHNLWMNPSGGKSKNPEKGSFRCWKTDTMGSLVKLVADYDNIPYEEAEEKLCGMTSLRALELKVHEFFGHKEDTVEVLQPDPEPVKQVELPEWSYLIDKMSPSHYMRIRARQYLRDRKIPTEGLYVCINGDYKDRIIIPYYDWYGELVWFNGRLMYDKKGTLKYMKCKSDGLNITQEDVLYMTSWPRAGTKIYLMEGEIDAISMKIAGLVGCAVGGKFLSDTQIEMIRRYEPVLAFDADEGRFEKDSGLQALINIGTTLLEKGFPKVGYVRPPKAYKDWNKLLVAKNPETVRAYAERFEKPFTPHTPDLLLAQRL
jgi:DNA primase